ncbi:MAG: SDR family oxidoreductase [Candidatus Nanosalina sp.]
MKILIAGKGFIGRKIAEGLRGSHEVKTLDRSGEATFEQDITENFSLEESFDAVFHTIGLAPGMHSEKEYRKIHVQGTKNLLQAVETNKIVYISALKAGEIDHSFFRTKKEAENLIRNSSRDYTIVRPSTVYGRGNRLLDLMRKTARTMVFPDLKTLTQPIHIDDLGKILGETVNGYDGEILDVGGPEKMSMGELAKKIYHEEGFPCLLIPVPEAAQKTSLRILDPLPGPFNRENIELLKHQNTTDSNDAEKILGELRSI